MTKKTVKTTKKIKQTPLPQAEVVVEQKPEPETAKNHYVLTQTDDKTGRWYVLHTYSGHENSVAINLIQRVETMKLDGLYLKY